MSLTMRQTEPADFDAIRLLAERTDELRDIDEEHFYYDDDELLRMCSSPHCVMRVVEQDDRIVGFGVMKIFPELREAYFEDIAIEPSLRGQGIGRLLFRTFLAELKNNDIVKVWFLVHEKNRAMQAIMQHYGLTVGRKFVYHEGNVLDVLAQLED